MLAPGHQSSADGHAWSCGVTWGFLQSSSEGEGIAPAFGALWGDDTKPAGGGPSLQDNQCVPTSQQCDEVEGLLSCSRGLRTQRTTRHEGMCL